MSLEENHSTQRDAQTEVGIKVLMVDDQAMVGEAMRRMLAKESAIEFHFLSEPQKAIEVVKEIQPTVILQDLVMPQVDGLTLVKFFRANERTERVPIIVLSSKEDPEIKQKAFECGANDYMVKFPDQLEVLARIRYHSQAYLNYLERIKSEKALQEELDQASRYVRSLFPEPFESDIIKADWAFMASTALAGDSLGYHWLDDEHFGVYVLDVCGHGVGAALLSVSALNVMRSQSLRNVDFLDPSAVLEGLNEAFDMEKQNNMYFTMWYGVYNRTTRVLEYASGGHPPSILVSKNSEGATVAEELTSGGMIVGAMPEMEYQKKSCVVPPGSRLYAFSDGVYEIERADGSGMMSYYDFTQALSQEVPSDVSKIQQMVDYSRQVQGHENFEDDYSLLEIVFK